MESDSPPRKKLKQARLPFQILSHKETTETTQLTTNRKRQLSEDSGDDVTVMKVVKTSDDTKENVTVITPVQEADASNADPSSSTQNEENAATEPSAATEALTEAAAVEPPQDASVNAQEGSILQKMKSNLANLLDKKAFDVTAEVGRCDCGCEDADSEEEAMKEYIEHCNKTKVSPKSKQSTPKEKVKKKSGVKKDSKQSSPSKESPSDKQKSRRKSTKISDNVDLNADKKIEPEKPADALSGSQPSEAIKKPEKNSILSQKAVNMFSKWRKTDSCDSEPKEEKDKRQLSEEDENKVVSKEIKKEQKQNAGNSSEISDDKDFTNTHNSSNNREQQNEEVDHENVDEKLTQLNKQSDELKINSDVPTTPKASFDKKDPLGNDQCCLVVDDEELTFSLTPTGLNKTPQRRLTPKQLERQKEVARKQEEKERLKLERENEKKRLKQEKDEQKRKEKEDKEEQRRKEKEEKEKKKQAELEQKNEEKRKKESLKAEEKRKKEEEKKKADEMKRKADEEEERKKAKASALFTSFFVPKCSKIEREDVLPPTSTVQNFMPFEIRADMKMAPLVRHTLNSSQKHCLDEIVKVNSNVEKSGLYLHTLKSGVINPKVSSRTWPLDEVKEDDDVSIIEEADDAGVLISGEKRVEKMKAKFLQFHENHRPAYHGTWRKTSNDVTGRRPFGQEKILDYEVDSADEWEEEEPGESLHGSDDEKEKESEDEYEVDNSVFVPHGYLSDDEGDEEESEEVLSPETQKAKLKLLGEEFEAQMKSKTSALKPIIIVLTAALQASSCSARYQKLLERRAVWQEDEGAINLSQPKNVDPSDGQGVPSSDPNCVTYSSGPGAKKKIISEEAIPALITLVHGNQNKRVFLTNEFSVFLGKSRSPSTENTEETATAGLLEAGGQPVRPCTPSAPTVNPLVLKWPGLPPASRISISNKIKEIATWGACPEDGPLHNRMCWYVPEEIRVKYGLVDMKLPNTQWHYTLKPKVFNHSNSPVANVSCGSASGPESRALITKFTKVMTPEEKQRQWESMKNSGASTPSSSKLISSRGSTGKITAFTQKVESPANVESKQQNAATSQSGSPAVAGTSGSLASQTSSTSGQPPAKKRVALLVSVPRGQQITSTSHCSLLSKFEAASPDSSSPNSINTVLNSNNTSSVINVPNSKNDDGDCILLD